MTDFIKCGAERFAVNVLDWLRADLAISFDKCHNGRFVLKVTRAILSASDLNFSTDPGFIDLHLALEHPRFDVLFHRVADSAAEMPSGAI